LYVILSAGEGPLRRFTLPCCPEHFNQQSRAFALAAAVALNLETLKL